MSDQSTRDKVIQLEERAKMFEEVLLRQVDHRLDGVELNQKDNQKMMSDLLLSFEKHNAVQSSWQRFVAPTLSGVIVAAVSALMYLLG
jgi:hypothetical protein